MSTQVWTIVWVILTFGLYIGIAIWAKAASTKEFYVAGGGVSPLANGMATAADWMSAASFISMAGLISFMGYDGSVFLMGWTGGYVLLTLLLAPYLRKFGKFTVPDFIGDRYYSKRARVVAVVAALIVSFTYVAGQMQGVGMVFSRFLEIDMKWGVVIGMLIVLFYATLGGMKGITYTQVAQYVVLIFAFMVPAFFISFQMTGNPIPQLGMGSKGHDGVYLLQKLDNLLVDLGFNEYTKGSKNLLDVLAITATLMLGTAGLPHVIVRFFTVPKVSDARKSGLYALIFIAILYTTAPAVAVFARTNLIETVNEKEYTAVPEWFKKWEATGLLGWADKNNDGKIQYVKGDAITGTKPEFTGEKGKSGERVFKNASDSSNELYVNGDIMVLANPEIANLPGWIIGLVAAGGLAAALSTAAGLLIVISSAISHDLIKKTINPNLTEKGELLAARLASVVAVIIAGYFGINPPGFVASVVAIAFGYAAATFFPAILLGIFHKTMNREGVIAGMIVGLLFTMFYVLKFKLSQIWGLEPYLGSNSKDDWWFGISPEGIGFVGMALNFITAFVVSYFYPAPPQDVQEIVENIRIPSGAGDAVAH